MTAPGHPTPGEVAAGIAVSLKEYFDRDIGSVRRDLEVVKTTIRETAKAHADAHERDHQQQQMAVQKADNALTIRLASIGQFQEGFMQDLQSRPTKAEQGEIVKRLEELILRGSNDLLAATATLNARLTEVERFQVSAQSSLGTMRALVGLLMGIIALGLAIAGFVLARTGG